MRKANIIPMFSPEFLELQMLFQELEPPYKLGDILRFNSAYRPIYRQLLPEEKRRAEEFVDALVAGVENRRLAPKIFGVV
jgi:hypothetical protein